METRILLLWSLPGQGLGGCQEGVALSLRHRKGAPTPAPVIPECVCFAVPCRSSSSGDSLSPHSSLPSVMDIGKHTAKLKAL